MFRSPLRGYISSRIQKSFASQSDTARVRKAPLTFPARPATSPVVFCLRGLAPTCARKKTLLRSKPTGSNGSACCKGRCLNWKRNDCHFPVESRPTPDCPAAITVTAPQAMEPVEISPSRLKTREPLRFAKNPPTQNLYFQQARPKQRPTIRFPPSQMKSVPYRQTPIPPP